MGRNFQGGGGTDRDLHVGGDLNPSLEHGCGNLGCDLGLSLGDLVHDLGDLNLSLGYLGPSLDYIHPSLGPWSW